MMLTFEVDVVLLMLGLFLFAFISWAIGYAIGWHRGSWWVIRTLDKPADPDAERARGED